MDRAICSVSLSSLCLFARREDSFARKSYNLASRAKLSSCLSGTISPKGDRALSAVLHLQAFATAFNRAEWSDKTFTDSTCVKSILQFIPFPLFVGRKRKKREMIKIINFMFVSMSFFSFLFFFKVKLKIRNKIFSYLYSLYFSTIKKYDLWVCY